MDVNGGECYFQKPGGFVKDLKNSWILDNKPVLRRIYLENISSLEEGVIAVAGRSGAAVKVRVRKTYVYTFKSIIERE